MVASWPRPIHKVLLPSITSTELRKITLSVRGGANWVNLTPRGTTTRTQSAQFVEEWTLVDEQLCVLAGRLRAMGCHHALEVEVPVRAGDPGGYDFTGFLPKFREKGVLIIVDVLHDNRILHSSADIDNVS